MSSGRVTEERKGEVAPKFPNTGTGSGMVPAGYWTLLKGNGPRGSLGKNEQSLKPFKLPAHTFEYTPLDTALRREARPFILCFSVAQHRLARV